MRGCPGLDWAKPRLSLSPPEEAGRAGADTGEPGQSRHSTFQNGPQNHSSLIKGGAKSAHLEGNGVGRKEGCWREAFSADIGRVTSGGKHTSTRSWEETDGVGKESLAPSGLG